MQVLADTKLVACANEILDIRGDVPGGEDIVGGKLGALIADFEHMTNQLKVAISTPAPSRAPFEPKSDCMPDIRRVPLLRRCFRCSSA